MKHNAHIQFESPETIKRFQEKRLTENLAYIATNSAFYQRVFAENNIDFRKIKTLEDLRLLPTTNKSDLQNHNRDFICVDRSQIIDYVTTSGTLGDPVMFALTDHDLERLAYNEYLSFTTAGCNASDVMQLMTTLDRRFMAGLAYYMGARELGAGIVRVGNGIPQLQWDSIRSVLPTFCMVVPSFLLKLIDYAENNGIDYNASSLKKAVCIGESIRNPDFTLNTLGKRINEKWSKMMLLSTYASTEMQASFTECEYQCGGHLQPELIIAELLDDEGNPVQEGDAGEVTITTLGVQGMPLIRFRTGDICYHYTSPCKCARHTYRLSSIVGRKGQLIKFKGTTLHPPALYDVLDNVPQIQNYIIEVYTNDLGTDEIVVRVGSENHSEDFEKELKDLFRSRVRVAPTIQFASPEYIAKTQFPEVSRKAVKFLDLRNSSKIN